MKVTKRNGELEELNLEKIHKVLNWAAEGLEVSVSQVEMNSQIQFYDGMKTEDIQEIMIKAAADLTSVDTPDYQYMAARLVVFNLRKKVYGTFKPWSLEQQIRKYEDRYDLKALNQYSTLEVIELDKAIDHNRDFKFAYAGIKQYEGKYALQDRTTKEVFETPQFTYMLIGMCLHCEETDAHLRLRKVIDFYNAVSLHKLSLPTPIMAGCRTKVKQFSSCTKIEVGDSLDSINASSNAIVKYVSQKAGIGLNAGSIRALGEPIRSGDTMHTGVTPFYKLFQAAVKSCSQGSVRNGAATLFYPLWHLEVESLLVLKNNKGVEENRVRHLDYGVQLNKLMYQRLIEGGNITLFSPNTVPGMYEAFFADQDKFEELYLAAEANNALRKKQVKAIDLFSTLMSERANTGRIYIQNVDHCNTHSPFDPAKAPIRQSNLCVAPETLILTKQGYLPIVCLDNSLVEVWNGSEWSEVKVRKTGESKKLIAVKTKDGYELECTPEHKFYVKNTYQGKPKEVMAKDLQSGDKLIKFELPVIEGGWEFKYAYDNGFYSGDGCKVSANRSRIYLYHDKKMLRDKLTVPFTSEAYQDSQNRWYGDSAELSPKFFVPTCKYTIKSRLEWLAGLLDSDGTLCVNDKTQSFQICSVNPEFLKKIQLMLQEMGVQSKVTENVKSGARPLPANDGTGNSKLFNCKTTFRLLINNTGIVKLLELGLVTHRLKPTNHKPNRQCDQFIKVTSVEDYGRVDDTYCFTEPKRNLGMFNGILTGQCMEIALPTKPMGEPDAEIALCTLAAFNLGAIESLDELEHLSEVIVEALDNLLDYQDYPMKEAEIAAKARRSLGVGVINYAYYLAKNGVKYSDGSANELTNTLFEHIQYYLLKASNKLAQDKGQCDWYKDLRYSDGTTPCWETYKESKVNRDWGSEFPNKWYDLEVDINNYGLRNSTLSAQMPSETSSQISNATNGIEPPRGLVSIKASKDGILKQVVPDIENLKDQYELLWDIPDNSGYLELVAIMQRWVDQSISANTNYDPSKFEGNKVPMKLLLTDLLTAYKLGIKTLYYHNTRDDSEEDNVEVEDNGCAGGACKI